MKQVSTIISDVRRANSPRRIITAPKESRQAAVSKVRPLNDTITVSRQPTSLVAEEQDTSRNTRIGKYICRLEYMESILKRPTKTKKDTRIHRSLFSARIIYGLIAVFVVVITLYVSLDTWLTNRSTASHSTNTVRSNDTSGGEKTAVSGDEHPSEKPLPENTLADYKVAPINPRAIYIKKIGVAARLMPMSVDRNNQLQAPANIYDAGWYTGSMRPGETGAMLVDAHSSGGTLGAVFDKLHELESGDVITIETGSDTKYNYTVLAKEVTPKEGVDMQKVLLPYGNTLKGLNLITCTGTFTRDYTTMSDRLVVYAALVN